MKLDILLKGIEYHLQQGSPENCEITRAFVKIQER